METSNKHSRIVTAMNVFTVLFFGGFIGYWIHKLALSIQNHSLPQILLSIGMILFNGFMMQSMYTRHKSMINQPNE